MYRPTPRRPTFVRGSGNLGSAKAINTAAKLAAFRSIGNRRAVRGQLHAAHNTGASTAINQNGCANVILPPTPVHAAPPVSTVPRPLSSPAAAVQTRTIPQTSSRVQPGPAISKDLPAHPARASVAAHRRATFAGICQAVSATSGSVSDTTRSRSAECTCSTLGSAVKSCSVPSCT